MPDGCWDSAIPITMPCGYAADAVLAGRSGAASRPAHPQTVAGLDLDAGTVDLLDLPMARFGAVVDRRGPCSSSPSGQVDRILKTILKSGIGPQELALRIARWRMSRRH